MKTEEKKDLHCTQVVVYTKYGTQENCNFKIDLSISTDVVEVLHSI